MIGASNGNPFVGLRPFRTDESHLFFGRDAQVMELLQRLHRFHFVGIVGGSGTGKSSLVRAGLIPKLKAGYLVNDRDKWIIASTKSGTNPLYNLTDAIVTSLHPSYSGITALTLKERIEEDGVDAILDLLSETLSSRHNFLLVIDQFEELFRFSTNNGKQTDEAGDFVNIILQLAEQNILPLYVIITIRSDFIGDCAQFFGLPEALNESQYLVPYLNRMQLKGIIENPVKMFNGRINPGLTSRLLNDVYTVQDKLPLLQHVLMRIWDRKTENNNGAELNIEDYEAVGGIKMALSSHADEALGDLSNAEFAIVKRLFQALTATDANGRSIRRPVSLSEVQSATGESREMLMKIINRFIENNRSFLVINETKGGVLLDISHETLIRQWETLNTWVNEEVESAAILLRLTESAKLYQENKKDLLSGNELLQVLQWQRLFQPTEAWAHRYTSDFLKSIDYLSKSEQTLEFEAEQKEIQRHKTDRMRRLLSTVILILIILICFLSYQNSRQLAEIKQLRDEKQK